MDEIKVLDKGFVRLEEASADDMAVVRSARVSYGKTASEPERDKKLVKYLLEHDHGTPFESNVFVFNIKCPIFTARQWMRHRIASYNEVSARYTEMRDEFYIPDVYRGPDKVNKQGSVEVDSPYTNQMAKDLVQKSSEEAFRYYQCLLQMGVAKEMARMVLPVNLYTQFYFSVNARALMHFIRLRSENHAQWEIRQYSDALFKFLKEKMPWTAEAFLLNLSQMNYPGLF